MKNFEPNPELYAKMKVPFESTEQVNENLKGFFDELKNIREKYKIENVVCWANGKVINEGQEVEFITGHSCGNIEMELQIIEYAHKQAVRNEIIRELQ